ncbi:Golgi apparatus membrane protein TVP23 [Guyanagaster necrorhizus]|uniref:Golgi apparatus membrane protein TVP23 n=1 Tax=Guyanagaster necrorhizus TaxID=856835 RepID=A0A9P7W060_9AGAR|nr:Golgi apparatus membrane protein TVP23 [Guyanagaster necrorhizus MCA 3950]KAG7450328.1 Golgi apparatus membrane protein TVP23 [Guyanagaster necrorhizus MCA 3950]
MSLSTPLLNNTIEPDDIPDGHISSARRPPLTNVNPALAANDNDAESGIAGIFRQSAHPLALFFLFLFRIAAITVYILCGFFTDNYVLSTVVVVVLLAMDFWNCRNVAGRTLVGLRFWNQVDDDGESFWVFESRDPSHPANPIDSKMFWIALYIFPCLWAALFIVSLLKLSISFVPIVVLALIFNITNAIGFTYADRDAKQRWANNLSSSWDFGGITGSLLSGAVKQSVGRMFK